MNEVFTGGHEYLNGFLKERGGCIRKCIRDGNDGAQGVVVLQVNSIATLLAKDYSTDNHWTEFMSLKDALDYVRADANFAEQLGVAQARITADYVLIVVCAEMGRSVSIATLFDISETGTCPSHRKDIRRDRLHSSMAPDFTKYVRGFCRENGLCIRRCILDSNGEPGLVSLNINTMDTVFTDDYSAGHYTLFMTPDFAKSSIVLHGDTDLDYEIANTDRAKEILLVASFMKGNQSCKHVVMRVPLSDIGHTASCESHKAKTDIYIKMLQFTDRLGVSDDQRKELIKNINHCSKCGSIRKCLVCSGCKAVYYCNASCQKAHWRSHKAECGTLKEIRKTMKQ